MALSKIFHAERGSWQIPAQFKTLQEYGKLDDADMYNTFNMGIGFVVVVKADQAARALQILEQNGVDAYRIGQVVAAADGVIL